MPIVKGKGSALRSGWPLHPCSGVLHRAAGTNHPSRVKRNIIR